MISHGRSYITRSVRRFIVRNATARPTERETAALALWLKSDRAFHCIRDHPSHARYALLPNLVGGAPVMLREIFRKSVRTLMRGYTSALQFLNDELWPIVKKR